VLIVNHPRSEGFGGYFSAAKLNSRTNTGGELWNDQFEAIEVLNDSDLEANRDKAVADWFAFLNLGKKMVAIGSSDSHHLRSSPVGYPRTCFHFGHDDPKKLSPQVVRDAIASGNSVVSGGLFMTVTGPGGERPGQSIKSGSEVSIVIESPGYVGGGVTLETIVNGKTISTTLLTASGAGPAKRYETKVRVDADAGAAHNWVVFHAKAAGDLAPLHPGRKPFAVSNALFLGK